jgi:deoxyribonuclease V
VSNHPAEWLHPPDLKAATAIQRDMAAAAEHADRLGLVTTIAGVDTSMKWRDSRGPIHAAAAPLAWPERSPLPAASVTQVPRFPYVSGYLGFREAPAILAALARLPVTPDLLVVDGQGRAHPRRCGVAVQIGVLSGLPAIGCAKSLLCGAPNEELGPEAGDRAPLIDRGEVVGMALRTRRGASPIYVSTGHRVSLDTAVEWILALSDGRRLPLPIRLAHDAANAARRSADQ